jgi:hypothetical protein
LGVLGTYIFNESAETKTPWRDALLEREELTFEFFETLKSGHIVEFSAICESPKEEVLLFNNAKTQGSRDLEGAKS